MLNMYTQMIKIIVLWLHLNMAVWQGQEKNFFFQIFFFV